MRQCTIRLEHCTFCDTKMTINVEIIEYSYIVLYVLHYSMIFIKIHTYTPSFLPGFWLGLCCSIFSFLYRLFCPFMFGRYVVYPQIYGFWLIIPLIFSNFSYPNSLYILDINTKIAIHTVLVHLMNIFPVPTTKLLKI